MPIILKSVDPQHFYYNDVLIDLVLLERYRPHSGASVHKFGEAMSTLQRAARILSEGRNPQRWQVASALLKMHDLGIATGVWAKGLRQESETIEKKSQ